MQSTQIGNVAEILLDYVENDRTFMTTKAMTVPSSAYTDEIQWQREIDLIFKKVPLMLALTCEMPNPGDYKAMEAVGLPVLITRGKDGTANAFLNVCSHRGATVAKEGHGNCSRFSCPYHGWTYANDGRLIGVADPQKFGDIDKSEHGLRELPCEERNGMIFVCLDPDGAMNIDAYYDGFLDDFDDLGLKDWSFLGTRVIEGANWKIAFDGYLEGYHFSSLHPETINPRTFSNITHYEGFGPNMRIGFPQRGIKAMRDEPRESWGKLENKYFDFVRIFFPNVSAFVAPEITQFAQLFPGPTPDKNRTVLMFVRKDPPKDDTDREAVEGMMDWLRNVVRDEDYWIGDEIQKGVKSGAHRDIIFGLNERGNQFFHEWVDWYLAEDPSRPIPEMEA